MIYTDEKVTIDIDKVDGISVNGVDPCMLNVMLKIGAIFQVKYDTVDEANEAYLKIKDVLRNARIL